MCICVLLGGGECVYVCYWEEVSVCMCATGRR